ncbi:hypothetical protein [Sphingomonas echinoides]|jgi:CheY-like chemotaxis protein|uniref:hypothetical protein n=1 Tax=Sphingomonas echinoides TaxID=59803 RepID=UPI003EEAAB7F
MNIKRILFVEDEKPQLDRFESAVGDWNAEQGKKKRKFEWHLCTDVSSADAALREQRFDCALFDLRLPAGTAGRKTEPAGSDLALNALNELGIPVGLMSADLSVVSTELTQQTLVKQFNKGTIDRGDGTKDAYAQAIEWFAEYWEMMDVLSAARARMERAGGEIFVERIWPRWDKLEAMERSDPKALAGVVTRQYVTHLADLLGIDAPDAESWHPFENYVTPPLLADRAHTGDIFEIDGELWIVLTPQCDMATGKVKSVLLARCVPGIDKWKEQVAAFRAATSKSAKKEPSTFLRDFVNQNLPVSRHFLPPLPGSDTPMLVTFTDVRTIPMPEIVPILGQRKASVATPFLPNLVQRFGAYISRTGQPNIDIGKLS